MSDPRPRSLPAPTSFLAQLAHSLTHPAVVFTGLTVVLLAATPMMARFVLFCLLTIAPAVVGLCLKLALYSLVPALKFGALWLAFKALAPLLLAVVSRTEDLSLKDVPVAPDKFDHHTLAAQHAAWAEQHLPALTELMQAGDAVVVRPAVAVAAHAAEGGSGEDCADVGLVLRNLAARAAISHAAPGCIVLLGTSHVSRQSAAAVKAVVKSIQPDLVFVELDRSRAALLHQHPPATAKEGGGGGGSDLSVLQVLRGALSSREHNIMYGLLQSLYVQLEGKLQVKAGGEFAAVGQAISELQAEAVAAAAAASAAAARDTGAVEAPPPAPAVHVPRVMLGDRPVQDTLRAMWAALKPHRRIVMCAALFKSMWSLEVDDEFIEAMKTDDMMQVLLEEFGRHFPELIKPLLHDRNWHMALGLWRCAQASQRPLVAVVGKGHVPGILYLIDRMAAAAAAAQQLHAPTALQ